MPSSITCLYWWTWRKEIIPTSQWEQIIASRYLLTTTKYVQNLYVFLLQMLPFLVFSIRKVFLFGYQTDLLCQRYRFVSLHSLPPPCFRPLTSQLSLPSCLATFPDEGDAIMQEVGHTDKNTYVHIAKLVGCAVVQWGKSREKNIFLCITTIYLQFQTRRGGCTYFCK